MPAQLQYRRDTAANWNLYNPVLFTGEIGYETDTGKFKIGALNLGWVSLPYFNDNGSKFTYTNSVMYLTSGSFALPSSLQKPNAQFKVTLVGGGGGGGGSGGTAGAVGNGGGSAGVVIGTYTYVSGVNTLTFTIGAGGTAGAANAAGNAGGNSTCTYNGVTFTANGGGGGSNSATTNGGGAGGTTSGGTFNFNGFKGDTGGICTANIAYVGKGADAPLGWGAGGLNQGTGASGNAATNYGSGGGGGRSTSATTRAGGAGAAGIISIQY